MGHVGNTGDCLRYRWRVHLLGYGMSAQYTPAQARELADRPTTGNTAAIALRSLADQVEELQAQLTELRLQKIAEFGELQDAAPAVPASVATEQQRFDAITESSRRYMPLIKATIDLIAACEDRHDTQRAPMKYMVPYGALNALRAALGAAPVAQLSEPPEAQAKLTSIIKSPEAIAKMRVDRLAEGNAREAMKNKLLFAAAPTTPKD